MKTIYFIYWGNHFFVRSTGHTVAVIDESVQWLLLNEQRQMDK